MAISAKLLNPGERVVVSTRTHVKALFGPALVLVALLVVGAAAQRWIEHDLVRLGVWVLVAIGVARYVVWPFLRWLAAAYTFTDRRLITRTGVLTRRGHDIPLSRISDVEIEKHLVDRFFGCGTLVVSDASTHGRVVLPDIPRVEETKRQVHALLHEQATERTGRDEGI